MVCCIGKAYLVDQVVPLTDWSVKTGDSFSTVIASVGVIGKRTVCCIESNGGIISPVHVSTAIGEDSIRLGSIRYHQSLPSVVLWNHRKIPHQPVYLHNVGLVFQAS